MKISETRQAVRDSNARPLAPEDNQHSASAPENTGDATQRKGAVDEAVAVAEPVTPSDFVTWHALAMVAYAAEHASDIRAIVGKLTDFSTDLCKLVQLMDGEIRALRGRLAEATAEVRRLEGLVVHLQNTRQMALSMCRADAASAPDPTRRQS